HARAGRQTQDLAKAGAQEHLAVDQCRRRQHAVQKRLVFLRLRKRLLPADLARLGIDALQRVAHGSIKLALVDKGPGALIGPDAGDGAAPQVRMRLLHLAVALGAAEADAGIMLLLGPFDRRRARAFAIVEIVGRALGYGEIFDGVLGAGAAHGDLLGLLLDLLALLFHGDLLAAAEVALPVPNRGRRGGVLAHLPQQLAIRLAKAIEGAFQRTQV